MLSVVLLSGGLDSAVVLEMARQYGPVRALSFNYGQRHSAELQAGKRLAERAGVERTVLQVDPWLFSSSALVNKDIAVPKDGSAPGVPVTYAPGRNLLFLAHACSFAESVGAPVVWIGVNALDYSGYPDCRPEFIEALQRTLQIGTKNAPTLMAPLAHATKASIIRLGSRLGVPFEETVSCYDADGTGLACGACDSCRIRRAGFDSARIPDPTRYRSGS